MDNASTKLKLLVCDYDDTIRYQIPMGVTRITESKLSKMMYFEEIECITYHAVNGLPEEIVIPDDQNYLILLSRPGIVTGLTDDEARNIFKQGRPRRGLVERKVKCIKYETPTWNRTFDFLAYDIIDDTFFITPVQRKNFKHRSQKYYRIVCPGGTFIDKHMEHLHKASGKILWGGVCRGLLIYFSIVH